MQGSEYFPKFYFFADIIATLSILLDITVVAHALHAGSQVDRTATVRGLS